MSDLNSFLAEESGSASTPADESLPPEAENAGIPGEPEPPAEPSADSDAPPEGMDKRAEAIWREERTRRKELQAQVDRMNDRWAQMVERMQQGQPQQPQQPQGEQPPAIEIPDFDEDPLGHFRAKTELLERQLAEITTERNQQKEASTQVRQFQQLQSNVDAMEREFVAKQPDYNEAVGFMYSNVAKMAQAMGYSPQQIQQTISQMAMDITARALQQNTNPAEFAYQAARQMGYTGPAPRGEGGEAPPASAGTPQRKPPTSLSSAAGRQTTSGMPTLDAIADMDDADFDKLWKDMERSAHKAR